MESSGMKLELPYLTAQRWQRWILMLSPPLLQGIKMMS